MEIWDIALGPGKGVGSRDYMQWRYEVTKIRDMAEYKLQKLWRMNFSPKDIENNKHWAIYPPDKPTRLRRVIGMNADSERGRKIGIKRKQYLYARALHDAAEGILTFHSLDKEMRDQTRKEMAAFAELMKKYSHKA